MGWRESGRLPERVFLATASCSHIALFFWQVSETVFRAPLYIVNRMRSVAASIEREITKELGLLPLGGVRFRGNKSRNYVLARGSPPTGLSPSLLDSNSRITSFLVCVECINNS
ncbi:uncharacterized protein P174DRAFT_155395 [Aspergillus novofumigatus IBT 16806]|uniref:Uncharacterized protein n=1 Tax=Aspergillus novofumigatus (strain IBT 16806) TaxID=1392255 RepID=A0A2I1CF39_ASPN1|nr:uncharacterized protein P174DRAFT_155395 [Aspergillus novofumigatus IBT 16806]PKX96221.1 hypothetical protein P174DRAFT_155395 [Aspergillus novofumigatus IBT 16806]